MRKHLALSAAGLAAVFLSGCRQDMQDQPKYIPYRASQFWTDGRSARMPVAGTVARGHLNDDAYLQTGKLNGELGDKLPEAITKTHSLKQILERGQNRYSIYCTPCHSAVGDGQGMAAQRGFNKRPASYHDERLKKQPLAHFYDVMTNGFGAMLSYNAQLTAEDRWAIAAYIRALQLSQDARISDVAESERDKIKMPNVGMPKPEAKPNEAKPRVEKKGGVR